MCISRLTGSVVKKDIQVSYKLNSFIVESCTKLHEIYDIL